MRQIWLVRHAESMAQIDETVDGVNPPLSARGESQACALHERIHDITVDQVLVSPLTRAWHTFALCDYQAAPACFDTRIIESDWGIPDYYAAELFDDLPSIAAPDIHHAFGLPAATRAASLLEDIENSEYSSYMLFGHWGIFMEIFRAFTRASLAEPVIADMVNTAVSLFEIEDDGRRRVRYWNDHAHVRAQGEFSRF